MKLLFRTIGYTLLALGCLAVASLIKTAVDYYSFSTPRYAETSKVCMDAKLLALVPQNGGLLDMGEVQICGMEMEISTVYGPDIVSHLERLQDENAALLDALHQCKRSYSL